MQCLTELVDDQCPGRIGLELLGKELPLRVAPVGRIAKRYPCGQLVALYETGDGLRAVFVLESGFDLGTGNSAQGGRLFGRQATLGLAGDSWGQLDFGRQTNIASKYLPGVADPFGGGFDQANIGGAFTAANTARYDNMVMYQTPNFSAYH